MSKSGIDKIKSLGTIMSIWAHPDDETFTSAGIMKVAVDNGQKVVCVTATKGEAGTQDEQKWPLESIAKIRENELNNALEVIGIDNHHWLGYKDGLCEKVSRDEVSKKLSKLINKYSPDTILTFGKDGITGHSDHCCVSCWVDDAVSISDKKPSIYHAVHTMDQYQNYLKFMDKELNIFFNIDEPPIVPVEQCDILLDLDDYLKSIKLKALSEMPSQTSTMLKIFDEDFISAALGQEAFVSAK